MLDTAVRRIEAQVDPEHPFGRPGRPMSSRSPFRVAFAAALGVGVAYALVQAVIAVRSVLILLLIAAFLAIGLNPAVEAVERRRIRRSLAVGVVLFAALLFFTGFGFAVVPPIIEQGQEFVETVPGYVTQLQDNQRIAELDERFQFLDRARESLDEPDALGAQLFGGVLSTFLLLMLLDVPYPVALAMLVAVTALIPLIGATIGGVIVTTVALFGSVRAGVICAIFYLVYQLVENYLLYPRVMQRSVDVSPAATVVAVLVGGSLLGVLGALLAIPLAAAVQLVLNEVVAPRQDTA